MSRTRASITPDEIEKQAEQYRQLAVSDHMDAGQYAMAHAQLMDTAARVRHESALPALIKTAMADFAAVLQQLPGAPSGAKLRPEEEN